MRHPKRTAAWLLVGVLALAGAAGAAEPSEGAGMLTAKDLTARTVTIDGDVYQVTETTRITNLDGARISLEEVRVQDPWGSEYRYAFEAVRAGGRSELRMLRLEEEPR